MSEQQTPKGPVLCKMGCGFFGSDATGNCCSKCWMDSIRLKADDKAATATTTTTTSTAVAALDVDEYEPMEICREVRDVVIKQEEGPAAGPVPANTTTTTTVTGSTKKKKTKRTSYKAMMAGMMTASDEKTKLDKEREHLSKGLGGGAFTKIEQI
mmetsp:Transcript_36704/g.85245  ORF Transcript_36704/g.85245 Transcript_36704/m.85245 type:complete len:155 (-) Transcript_36704:50-514(-)|eukprot:CAMPEP_0176207550 /NCGR_PEP_ID=MMETSP0121_2-20121125/12670_1 /TAXON_ID=160619 /ORGANISM="Kryptoperidinium foliaceum, Strain CCMP 1326" /LENGTH=154 /DNA_ID=CAMNT_0017546523 /DNA_START=140 /DNA_END=604 /DNA_ORIENTATION=-